MLLLVEAIELLTRIDTLLDEIARKYVAEWCPELEAISDIVDKALHPEDC